MAYGKSVPVVLHRADKNVNTVVDEMSVALARAFGASAVENSPSAHERHVSRNSVPVDHARSSQWVMHRPDCLATRTFAAIAPSISASS